jgi:hypothetical protein
MEPSRTKTTSSGALGGREGGGGVAYDGLLDLLHLDEQLRLLLVAAGRVDDNDLKVLFLKRLDTSAGDLDRVRLRVAARMSSPRAQGDLP